MENTKKPEGKDENNKPNEFQKDNSEKNELSSVETTSNEATEHIDSADEGMPFEELEKKSDHKKTIKNLISAVIILSGIAAGSFFVDIVQFIGGSGYSEKALREAKVFVAGEKTWVAFEDPAVEVEVLTVGDEDLEDCENCDPEEVLLWLKRFIPTLVSKKVIASSPEGERLIDQFGLKSIPAFVFSKEIEESEFYEGEASVLFEQEDEKFVLNSSGLGIPVGKFIETPGISDSDPVLGDLEKSKVNLIVFSDFQCPYCKQYFTEVKAIAEEREDVALIYKDLPLDFHPRAEISAIAARCAQQQDKFWEMSELLYGNQDDWANETSSDIFKQYARQLGLDATQFNDCVDEKNHIDLIEEDVAQAEEFGVSGTPATFINEQFISGVVQGDELRNIIDEEVEKE